MTAKSDSKASASVHNDVFARATPSPSSWRSGVSAARSLDSHHQEHTLRQSKMAAEQAREELRLANDALNRSNARLTALAYAVSHDLRAPARQIRQFLRLLEEHLTPTDRETDEWVQLAQGSCDRLMRMLDDLFASLKGAERKMEAVDVRSTLDAALANIQSLINEADATIEIGELPVVECAPVEMTQLFQNLVSNAINYRGERRLHIVIDAEPTEFGVRYRVQDNGLGIKPTVIDQIFLPFRRATEQGQGLGMGLSICQNIVENRNGKIWVESSLERGSTFFFELPGAPVRQPSNRATIEVLVVDDDEVDRLLTKTAINNALTDAHVHSVDGGAAAIAHVERHTVHCVILDYQMPGMNGRQTLEKLRSLDRCPAVVAISNGRDPRWMVEMTEAGAIAAFSQGRRP